MAKFMVLYSSSASAKELMANATPAQMKTSMEEWIKWREEASKQAQIDFGLPLQAVSEVGPNGVGESSNHVNGYSIMEADSEDVILEIVKTHPHLKRTGATIDVLEMLSMPGLDA